MKKSLLLALRTASLSAAYSPKQESETAMPVAAADKDIIDNAVNSRDHTTLVAALKAAGLVDTLKSAGPFSYSHPPTRCSMHCPPVPSTPCSSPG